MRSLTPSNCRVIRGKKAHSWRGNGGGSGCLERNGSGEQEVGEERIP